MPNRARIEETYPLQRLTIKLQGTQHSRPAKIINQLEQMIARLKAREVAEFD